MSFNEKHMGRQISSLRKERGLTQDELAALLHVSPQAISKWENGHSLPETALLHSLAKVFGVMIDDLFSLSDLIILEALFGDGLEAVNVTKRLNRLVENNMLAVTVAASLLGVERGMRTVYLTVKYQTEQGICFVVFEEGTELRLTSRDEPQSLPAVGIRMIAGSYGSAEHHYDVMRKIEHYKLFGWRAYHANHEIFPSDPANDGDEYLTLIYLNHRGINMATCAEGESLAFSEDGAELLRQGKSGEYCIPGVPKLPPFGEGMECSWAAALTVALISMGVETDYSDVMGVSGACWRLAFHSPMWDYSSADGLVAYDYATPGFAAYGYSHEMFGHIEKEDRTAHRARIIKEVRGNMPILGINLRVAAEWGVICGYRREGAEFFCRTKYDKQTIENDPAFMSGSPVFKWEHLGPYDTLPVDNWPFLLCYFSGKTKAPTPGENLRASLRVFIGCSSKAREGGYALGFEAYDVWARDLRDDVFYKSCGDEQFARRFSVDQFCTLALLDARRAARDYLKRHADTDGSGMIGRMAALFERIYQTAQSVHTMLDSGEVLDGPKARAFWTEEKRHRQAEMLDEMQALEREACELAKMYLGE